MPRIIVFIRNIDEETYHRAKVAALKARMTVCRWIEDAIKEKLSRKKG